MNRNAFIQTRWFVTVRRVAGALLALTFLGCPGETVGPLERDEVGSLVAEATFIFEGRVSDLGKSTVSGVAPDRAVIVEVGTVHRAPRILRGIEGRRITVLTKEPRPFRPQTAYLFFCRPAVFGRGIAVREIGTTLVPEPDSELAQALATEIREHPDRVLQDYLSAADLVVSGEVVEVAPVEQIPQRPFVSEHYPDWRRATVRVARVERGRLGSESATVTVFFPASRDVMWYGTPKLRVGQQAAWVLTSVSGPSLPANGFAAVHPADVRPLAELPRIRQLIRKIEEEGE